MKKEPPRTVNYFRFEELRVYHKALDYAAWLRTATSVHSLSDDCESNKLVNAATLIALYLAEGSTRKQAQFVHFLKMVKTQIRECMVRTSLCYRLDMLTDDDLDYSKGQLFELTKMISALSMSITKTQHDESDDYDTPAVPDFVTNENIENYND